MAVGPDDAVPGSHSAQDAAFQSAVHLRRQGQATRADALCAELLRVDPRHFNAYHLLGLIALDKGETHRGIELIGRSLAINPHQPLAYSNVGNALLSVGQPARALASLDAALALKPDFLGLPITTGAMRSRRSGASKSRSRAMRRPSRSTALT